MTRMMIPWRTIMPAKTLDIWSKRRHAVLSKVSTIAAHPWALIEGAFAEFDDGHNIVCKLTIIVHISYSRIV